MSPPLPHSVGSVFGSELFLSLTGVSDAPVSLFPGIDSRSDMVVVTVLTCDRTRKTVPDVAGELLSVVLTLALVPPDGEGFEPRFCCLWFNIAEHIRRRGCSSFHLTKDTFDAISISVATDMKSESES